MREFALNMFIHACPVLLIQPSSVCDLCFSFYFYFYFYFFILEWEHSHQVECGNNHEGRSIISEKRGRRTEKVRKFAC